MSTYVVPELFKLTIAAFSKFGRSTRKTCDKSYDKLEDIQLEFVMKAESYKPGPHKDYLEQKKKETEKIVDNVNECMKAGKRIGMEANQYINNIKASKEDLEIQTSAQLSNIKFDKGMSMFTNAGAWCGAARYWPPNTVAYKFDLGYQYWKLNNVFQVF